MSSRRTREERPTLFGRILYNRRITRRIGRYTITYEHRSRHSTMGRFGGGWQWNLGIQIGPSSVILNLLVAILRISKQRKETAA